jgi:hypothetical protein
MPLGFGINKLQEEKLQIKIRQVSRRRKSLQVVFDHAENNEEAVTMETSHNK